MTDFSLRELARMDRLRQLHREHGWHFTRTHSPDPPHELDELVYSLCSGEWLDVLRVRSDTEAKAGRFLTESVAGGGCPQACWLATGTLAHVLDELHELPPPTSRLAPRLILPTAVRTP